MNDPSRVRVDGALAPFADGFRVELSQCGYAAVTAALHLQMMGHLSRWLAGQGLDGAALTSEVVDEYLVARRAVGYVNHRSVRGLQPLLDYLRRREVAPWPVPSEDGAAERLLSRYAGYLARERGLAESTVRNYVELVRPFLADRGRAGDGDLRGLTAGDVTAFVVASCRGPNRAMSSWTATALRSLLRFLHVDGLIDAPLVDAVPSVAAWKLAGLPKTLRAVQVTALLAPCDADTPVGSRASA